MRWTVSLRLAILEHRIAALNAGICLLKLDKLRLVSQNAVTLKCDLLADAEVCLLHFRTTQTQGEIKHCTQRLQSASP